MRVLLVEDEPDLDIAGTDPRGLDPHLPRIRRATRRLTDVVENVLTRGRLQAAGPDLRAVPLRLDQLVEQACEDSRTLRPARTW
ncbi:hypothetical protein [Streptomyces sp. A0592]|uniref:hypothetical protein n=1 Tax=Streptomyces sp. A0592 TaxID=2563099 RepID=UPI001F106F25|nr:hypothetical protein [Streptomyces sp. A0592]